ncbi:Hypothetical_protein [Hexamita inflata]|uniref:Hypothetical_protein n=1 Tax=Hexamita inflata TaxID=28002 RepID=A0ABP1GMA6_9EUKA
MIKSICHIELDIEQGPVIKDQLIRSDYKIPPKLLQLPFLAQKQVPNQLFYHIYSLGEDYCLSTTVATPSDNKRKFLQSAVTIVFTVGSLPNLYEIGSVILKGILSENLQLSFYESLMTLNLTSFQSKLVRFQSTSSFSCLPDFALFPLYASLIYLCENKQVLISEQQAEPHFSSIFCFVASQLLSDIITIHSEPLFDPMADDFDSKLKQFSKGPTIIGTNNEYVKKKLKNWTTPKRNDKENVFTTVRKISCFVTGSKLFKGGEKDICGQFLGVCFGEQWKDWAEKHLK